METALSRCELCPRRCGTDRAAGRRGFCGAGRRVEVFRFGPHHGEEPPVSGTRGSGTVFFSRCTLRCIYCQNHPWSQGGQGREYGAEDLARIFRSLQAAGCHNWNLVSPTPWLPMIAEALAEVRKAGVALPVVYNTSGFERPETLEQFAQVADVYLTDLRYAEEASAAEGSGSAEYVRVAREALLAMWRRTGPLRLGGDEAARSGTICRLLILPGRASEAVANLRWLAEKTGGEVPVSVMAQYVPAHAALGRETWNRSITREEYEQVCGEVENLGFAQGWVQEFGVKTPSELVGYEMEANTL